MNKPAVEMVATDKLIPYARNAKKHDEAQVSLIAGSIRQFGFCNPVLIAEDNGIVAGHGRVLAAMKLGMAEVPCIRLSHLDENQRRAYILADNRLAELGGGWDADMLAAEVEAIDWAELDAFKLDDMDLGEMMGQFDVQETDAPDLKDGDRAPFRQATFTLHDEQWEEVESALAKAKKDGGGQSAVNENSNGNALAWICRAFNGSRNG
jgi:ParB family chromosome partitioning protein